MTQGRRLALLAMLALARGRPMTRDKLIALLWPESTTERARHHLSDTVYILRSTLGDEIIRSAADELSLSPSAVECDATVFEQQLDAGRLQEAIEAYGGPLLDGFHLPDAVEFERWLESERARLGQRHAQALQSLAEQCEQRGELDAAVGWWRRAAVHDSYDGRIALRLMRALEASGHRAEALQHARAHAALLRKDFDAEPEPDVTAFAERLRVMPPVRPEPEPLRVSAPVPSTAPVKQRPGARRVARSYAAVVAGILLLAVVGVNAIRARATAPKARSVAVLPFVNMSADPGNAYFSDGLSEQIIAALGRIEGLQVAARTSSFALRDRALDVRAIGDTLSVAAVLEGSVRRDGNRLRVTAQLIDATTGYHLWAEDYDRELAGVIALQDDIARAIAGALELRLAGGIAEHRDRRAPSLEAYDLYLRGMYLRNSMSADKLEQAEKYFRRAIELAPDFALAHAGMASIIGPQIYYSYVPQRQGVTELRAQVTKALELDPTLGEAYASLGMLRLFFEWDWAGAEQALRRAIALNPSDAHAHHHLANYLNAMGRWDETLASRERALELDPLNPRSMLVLARAYLRAGRADTAIAIFRKAQRLEPMQPILLGTGPSLPTGVAEVYHRQGRHDEAIEEYIGIARLRGAAADETAALRDAYAKGGVSGFWRRWLEMELRQFSRPDPLRLASIWLLIGDTTRAMDWVERAYEERNPGLIFARYETALEGISGHPRFARIIQAMNFPAAGR